MRGDGSQYDVFLSFRGPDTRSDFTEHLYYALEDKGIVTFLDSEKLEKGKKLAELFECIRRSKIFVPIFSKGYADSDWCLKEIAEIVDCKRTIIPVFFGVDPRDVRHQTGPFAPAFERHRKDEKIQPEEVSKWSAALTEAGEISSYVVVNNDGQWARLIQLIVKGIVIEVHKTTQLVVAKHPVELDVRIADVMKVLEVEAQESVRIVGIYGMGGIGKTTLAKAVFNQLSTRFDRRSFIRDVREAAKQTNGLVSRQNQLLHQLFNDKTVISDIDQGTGIIKRRIGSKEVLLVLDDVDDKSQLDKLVGGIDSFCSGSIIIITSRYKGVLESLESQRRLNLYELKGLNATASLQLFSWHAFGKKEPDAKFAKLSKEVVDIANGLPLALEVFGSHFFDLKDVKEWKDMLEKLTKDQDKGIHDKLKISYDALDDQQKNVFLDIACFFIGNGRKHATLMWEDCNFYPDLTIKVLVHKSLISINGEGEFEMHDHIRDMGRKIIHDERPKKTGGRSRLWKEDEILDVLQNKRGKDNVEAIQLLKSTFGDSMSVEAESFEAMTKLRMLQLGEMVTLGGQYERFPKELRWLQWQIPRDLKSLPAVLSLENIVVLDLSFSSITQVWDLQTYARVKAFRKLKVLKLVYCRDLTSCPDFSSISMPRLQELDFEGCEKMRELHPSVGLLKSLTHLNLSSCRKMRELHPSVGELKSLTHLNLSWCYSLEKLPEQICELTSLEWLDLCHCYAITILPSLKQPSARIEAFPKLKVLKLVGCRYLTSCPDFSSIRMPSLQQLDFKGCGKMGELHPSVGLLKSLTHLNLCWCKSLKKLPEEIYELTSLERLDLCHCNGITTLPSLKQPSAPTKAFPKLEVLKLAYCRGLTSCPDFSSIRMPSLQELDFEGCEKMGELHPSIGHLKSLTHLNLSSCSKMMKLHPSVGLLKSLTHLNLNCCRSLEKLPEEIYELTSLEELDLRYCEAITTLPSPSWDSKSLKQHLLGKLKVLQLSKYKNLTICPDFTSMPHLQQLHFEGCEKMSELDRSVGQLKSLIYLNLEECKSLKELPQEVGQLTSLTELNLGHCSQISTLPKSMERLKQLQILDLSDCSLLQEVPEWILSLDQLEILTINDCHQLTFVPQLPPSLIELNATHCFQLQKIADVSNLKGLEELDLTDCESLVDIPGIEQLNCLRRLGLGRCRSLNCDSFSERVQDLEGLRELDLSETSIEEQPALGKLEEVSVRNCDRLKSLPKLPPSLHTLDAEGCTELTMIQDVSNAKRLQRLNLNYCRKLVDIPGIEQLEGLETLKLEGCSSLNDSLLERLQDLISNHQSFGDVDLSWTSIKELPALGNLKALSVHHCDRLKSLGKFPSSLGKLNAADCTELTMIEDVSNAKRLDTLDLRGCVKLVDIPGIEQLEGLQKLDLGGCRCLFVKRLQDLDKLEMLDLHNFENLTKCPDFINLKGLEMLDLSCTTIEELPALEKLEKLQVGHCNRLKSLPKLPPSLHTLYAAGCTELTMIQDVSSAKRLTSLHLRGCIKLSGVPGIEQLEGLETLELGGCRSLHDSFLERLKVVNFQLLETFSMPGWLVNEEGSYPQSVSVNAGSLSFLLPKQFIAGILYLYVDQSSMDRICSELYASDLVESYDGEEDRNLDSFGSERADKSITRQRVIDNQLSRSVVRVNITTNDTQFSPFLTFFDEWDAIWGFPMATFRWDRKVMMRFEGNDVNDDDDAQQSKTMMMMHVSIDGCILLKGDLFTDMYGYFSNYDMFVSELGEVGLVKVEFYPPRL